MCCDDFKRMLDAYIDGELTEAEISAINEHAKACDTCREGLQAAWLLKDTLAHMDDEIAVPLQAQAAWRNAVRAEAAKRKGTVQKKRNWMRYAYAAAAVFVLAFGVNFAFEKPDTQLQAPGMRAAGSADIEEVVLVARDGVAQPGGGADVHERWKISAENVQDAMDILSQLAAEYNGSFIQEGDAACRIELPAQYQAEFGKAADRIGEVIYSETLAQANKTAVLQIQITSE